MKKLFTVGLAVLLVGLGLYFGLGGKDKVAQIVSDINPSSDDSPTDEDLAPIEPDAIFKEPIVYSSLKQSYSHTGFSFKYSDGFKVSSTVVETGEVVTIENSKGSGFQIFIITWDEAGSITPERIWKDQPDMEINDPKNAVLDGVQALVFNGFDEDMGETFEAWAVYKGKLYQIAGPKTAEKLVIETLETWDWK